MGLCVTYIHVRYINAWMNVFCCTLKVFRCKVHRICSFILFSRIFLSHIEAWPHISRSQDDVKMRSHLDVKMRCWMYECIYLRNDAYEVHLIYVSTYRMHMRSSDINIILYTSSYMHDLICIYVSYMHLCRSTLYASMFVYRLSCANTMPCT